MVNEKIRQKMVGISIVLLSLSLAIYFFFRTKISWIPLIVPEFVGTLMLFFITLTVLNQKIKIVVFRFIMVLIFLVGVFGFVTGFNDGITVLKDFAPELIAVPVISLLLSYVIHRRVII